MKSLNGGVYRDPNEQIDDDLEDKLR